MNNLLRAGLALGLVVSAAACSSSTPPPAAVAPPPPPPPAAPTPPAAATNLDGVYRGEIVRTAKSAHSCRSTHHATIRIMNGMFAFAASKSQDFTGVQVNQDGSFTSTVGDTTMAGNVANGAMTGTLDGSTCHYTLHLKMHMMKK